MPDPVITSPEPFAWMVHIDDQARDYIVFPDRDDAVEECRHQIENSDPAVDSWDLWPLYRAQAEQVSFD